MVEEIQIIGVPMDLGQGRRGVDMGPSAVRYAGLNRILQELGYPVYDRGNIAVPGPEEIIEQDKIKHLSAVSHANQLLAQHVEEVSKTDSFSIVLGGDHSIAAGSVAGLRRNHTIGVLWVDAHGDYNTPDTSPSGNLHGMPLSSIVGKDPKEIAPFGDSEPLRPGEVVLLGVRELDPQEKENLLQDGVPIFTMRDIDELGIAEATRRALLHFTRMDIERIHLSLDLDVLDPQLAPGVGTPVPGGLTYREAHLLMEILSEDERIKSMDLVEINPILDIKNRTAEMAVDLTASLLGKRIL
ncbi:MAG: arginase [Planctomycetota bacterium]|nr:MAG: arginase [Planctomycetota bacterium]